MFSNDELMVMMAIDYVGGEYATRRDIENYTNRSGGLKEHIASVLMQLEGKSLVFMVGGEKSQ